MSDGLQNMYNFSGLVVKNREDIMVHKWKKHQWFVRVLSILVIFQMAGAAFELPLLDQNGHAKVSAAGYEVKKEQTVSPDVNYTNEQIDSGSYEQSTYVMEIGVDGPNSTIQMTYPEPFPTLDPVTTQAQSIDKEGNRVLGSINGSFFHVNQALPAYLISENQNIFNLGAVSDDANGYMSVPTAFGMTPDGRAMLGKYELDLHFDYDGDSYTIDSYNKDRDEGEIILYTPNDRFDWTKTNEYGMEIAVSGLEKPVDSSEIKFGDTVTGEVELIKEYGDDARTKVPDDGFVLSIQGGAQAAKFEDVEKGDSISLQINNDNMWENADYMLASGPMLVNNGEVDLKINENSSRARARAPRTAVGINEDGSNVYFIAVDGRQNGYSDGMTLKEFAEYIESKGIYKAINLDGGGSTTITAREPGDKMPSVINSPSDGYQRPVSSTLHAVNTAETGEPSIIKAHKEEQGKVVEGSSVDVAVDYLLDENYYPLDKSQVELSVDGGVGHMEGKTFVAEQAGSGEIVASAGDATKRLPIEVVETVDRLEITPEDIKLGTGTKQTFDVQGFSDDNEKIIFNKNTATWDTEGSIGTISDNGVLQAADSSADGAVVVNINGHEYKASVSVGGTRQILDGFTSSTAWDFDAIRARGTNRISQAFEPVAAGDTSMRFEYNFATGDQGIAASYLVRNNPVEMKGRPNHIGMWVYGDGSDHWLRGKLLDGTGKTYTVSFTEEGELDWNGWKYVKAEVPDEAALPLSVHKLYVAETSEDNKDYGVLFLDRLRAAYNDNDDEINNLQEYDFVEEDKEWDITFNTALRSSTVTNENIYVETVSGEKVEADVTLNNAKDVVTIEEPDNGYTGNQFYKLIITEDVESSGGAEMRAPVEKVFQVD